MKRGDVYWANLASRSGAEQQGARPVIVVSHDGFNQSPSWRSVIVVPVSTSASQSQRGPTADRLPAGSGGLTRASGALCHQVTTLDRGKLSTYVGTLSDGLPVAVGDGLKIAQDLP